MVLIFATSNFLTFLTLISSLRLHCFLMRYRFSIVFPVLYPFLEFSTSACLSSGFPLLKNYFFDYLFISIIVLFFIYVIIYANIYIYNYLILFSKHLNIYLSFPYFFPFASLPLPFYISILKLLYLPI